MKGFLLLKKTVTFKTSARFGLSHTVSNFVAGLRYCDAKNLRLAIPEFTLSGFHNNKKRLKTKLTEYVDVHDIRFYEPATKQERLIELTTDCTDVVDTIIPDRPMGGLWRLAKNIKDIFETHAKQYHVRMKAAQPIIDNASQVTQELGSFNCIHVRVKDGPMKMITTPDVVLKTLEKHADKSLTTYVMTDETNMKFFDIIIDSGWRLKFYTDYPALSPLKSHDNYKLFWTEREISKVATHMINREHIKCCHKDS